MLAEILSTGDEVLTGAVIDSNAAHIARKLLQTGLCVVRHTAVGDDLDRLIAAMKEIGDRSDIAVITGGLGPTLDDLTAEAAARAAGAELVENPTALSYIEAFFSSYFRSMTVSDRKQAMMPAGAVPIVNSAGTAPGFRMRIGGCACFFLPGVPSEMYRMLEASVLPVIASECLPADARQHFREKLLTLFGLPEATVNERIAGLVPEFGEVRLGMIARFPVIDVKLSAYGKNLEQVDRQIERAAGKIQAVLDRWIFSTSQETMEEVAGKLLKEKGATVALAESCTGGLIAHRLTNVPGSSDYLLLSAVTYSNAAKTSILGVPAETIAAHGAVSEPTVRLMAEGARRIAGSDYGLSVSGIAGPSGGTAEKPVGTVCIGIAGPERTLSRRIVFPFRNRAANKEIFAQTALDMLRRELMGLEGIF